VRVDDATGPCREQACVVRQTSGFDEALGDNALEAFISRLRKKLADSGATIRTLRGIGYVLEEQL